MLKRPDREAEHSSPSSERVKRDRGHLEVLGVDGRVILKWMLKESIVMPWTVLVQNRDRYRVLVKAVIYLWVT